MTDLLGVLTDLFTWVNAAAAAVGLGLGKWILRVRDRSTETVRLQVGVADRASAKVLTSVQPMVLVLITLALQWAQTHLGLVALPPAEAIAAAPVSAVLAIVLRELVVRFIKPWLPDEWRAGTGAT